MLNLHNFLNVNIPVLTQSFLFVCYCLSHEIDSLISLSAEKGSSAFSNHRGKSNKLPTSRMHLQHPHACAFPADSPIKITSLWSVTLFSNLIICAGFCFWRGNQNVSKKCNVNSSTSAGLPEIPQLHRICFGDFKDLPHSQEFFHFKSTWTT